MRNNYESVSVTHPSAKLLELLSQGHAALQNQHQIWSSRIIEKQKTHILGAAKEMLSNTTHRTHI